MSANAERLDAHIHYLRERMPEVIAKADAAGGVVALLTVFVSTDPGALGMCYVAPEGWSDADGDEMVREVLTAALDAAMFREPTTRIETVDDGGGA